MNSISALLSISQHRLSYLNDSTYVHLGDHLGSKQEGDDKVNAEGHIHQGRLKVKGLGSVHTDRDDTGQGTHP